MNQENAEALRLTERERNEQPEEATKSILGMLLPVISAVFVAYLVIGLAMPTLPLHVHQGLGLSTFVVGLVAGSQFAVSLLTRPWAGYFADSRGGKRAIITGMLVALVSGLLYAVSLLFVSRPLVAVAVLLLGRGALGVAESFIVTGALSWGLGLGGLKRTGKVMSWLGTALYAAFAIGAPVGTMLYARAGFGAIAAAAVLLPIIAILMLAPIQPTAPTPAARPSFLGVIRSVWMPGLGLAISGIGFGAITTFIVLLFAQHGWEMAWIALTLLSVAFIFGRMVFGHLPDRNGAGVALVCVLIEAVGQALIWLAPGPGLALVGVTLSGLGYSLVYPGFGVEALRHAKPENRGLTMGAYTSFLDLSLGLTGPVLGLVANRTGLDAVFLVSTLLVLGSAGIAGRLLSARADSA